LNPQQIENMKVSEEDLLDCVEQAEKELGGPEDHRLALGLFPDSGYTNIGQTYVSKSNPHIVCVFTPTSMKFATTNPIAHDKPPVNAYFEWYYSDIPLTANASRTTNVTISPVVPGYDEACERTDGIMGLQEREQFLNKVWMYHRTCMPGHKARVKNEILEVWERVNRVNRKLVMQE
jgi:hypothetical protein